jgi:hypothetical protein
MVKNRHDEPGNGGISVESLFHLFSSNLMFYRPEHRGVFMCPLCLRVFTPSEMGKITKAHLLSQRLGGRRWTLACKECNNTIGTQIESYETTRAHYQNVLMGRSKSSIRVQLECRDNDGSAAAVHADMRVDGPDCEKPVVRLNVADRSSNPKQVQQMQEWIRSKAGTQMQDWEFGLSFQARASWRKGTLAYLHAAFLLLFDHFGYEWALDPTADTIRRQLRSPDEEILQAGLLELCSVPEQARPLDLTLITEPQELHGFLTILPQLSHFPSRMGVWTPLFGTGYGLPGNMDNGSMRMSVVYLPLVRGRLADDDFINCAHRVAHEFCLR